VTATHRFRLPKDSSPEVAPLNVPSHSAVSQFLHHKVMGVLEWKHDE